MSIGHSIYLSFLIRERSLRVEGSFFSDTVKCARINAYLILIRDIGANSKVAGGGGLFEGGTYFVVQQIFILQNAERRMTAE